MPTHLVLLVGLWTNGGFIEYLLFGGFHIHTKTAGGIVKTRNSKAHDIIIIITYLQ